MSFSFVFPGQGSQFIGMGKDIYGAFSTSREVFEEVNDALKQNLSKLIFEGSEADLALTQNTQPALMTVSIAIYKTLTIDFGLSSKNLPNLLYAGHSLGEYTAYTAAGSFTLSQAATLLRIRGNAMQEAVPAGQGKMAAILGLDFEAVEKLTLNYQKEHPSLICEAANDNAPGQVVISGHTQAIEDMIKIATQNGAKRAILLPVSAPFHCRLMDPAAKKMHEALSEINIKDAHPPIISNVTTEKTYSAANILQTLVQQVTDKVRWRETIIKMKNLGVEHIIEIGAGKVLTGLTRRIDKSLNTLSIQTPQDIENFANFLERN